MVARLAYFDGSEASPNEELPHGKPCGETSSVTSSAQTCFCRYSKCFGPPALTFTTDRKASAAAKRRPEKTSSLNRQMTRRWSGRSIAFDGRNPRRLRPPADEQGSCAGLVESLGRAGCPAIGNLRPPD